ncbi:hypothetical protein [Roseospirillum parvum]|uniref:Bacteriophage lambda head decoration protein D n=1 Tax=Roseospirillum parvum TaxID=83401 RepID=A0A1G8GBR7_9PROT|nr:hypothetical protein [Roseospirillum parvum]SDH91825.1 hypothetical protein SAMN05421742_1235 [Roseospirillum parvum]
MAALTADRNTPEKLDGRLRELPVAADTVIHAGALTCLDAAGNAVPGSTATTLTAVGRAEARADNAGGSAGDVTVKVKRGVFRFANSSGGDEVDRTHIGNPCYAVDDQTVAATDGTNTRSIAGLVYDVDDLGVWVEIS